ncbi:hypothetical protein G6O69_09615 [Pseudenhygromyxa sp. WMMC2535]|uniref:hypothetical protein n=1 Tax=Pseudenhygromyxa sp. WMMC2535 TaxID=2712867 RepID=UPI0015549213|nr:hypothetical protein [Pseudenhygromyxa sp. WMMC2535]NVB38088.1 hypothetical protein [Pseudenhygromyxa sp. WMMC2535]
MSTAQLQADPRAHSLDSEDPSTLARMSMRELDELFAGLQAPPASAFCGHQRGRVIAIFGLDWLPREARALLFKVVAELPLWRGQDIEGEFGANAWLLPYAGLHFGRFLVREVAGRDGGEVLRLDYDVAANPRPLRRLSSELRRLDDGLYLVRVQIRLRGDEREFLYVTLKSER